MGSFARGQLLTSSKGMALISSTFMTADRGVVTISSWDCG